jgi:DNA-binding SARP family transcriptional activator
VSKPRVRVDGKGIAGLSVASELKVRVVGGFVVCWAGRALTSSEAGSRKARTLLAVLAVHPSALPVDRIAAALWGDVQPRDPVANLATLVSRLRATFGADTIVGDRRAGYRLGNQVRIDLFEAADLVAESEMRIARGQPGPARTAAWHAIHALDHGDVLAEHPDARWAEPARALHRELLRRARHAAAEAALHTGEIRAARAAAEAAATTDAFDEVAYRLLMRAHRAAGEPARALLAFHQLRTVLATELGVDPAPATRNLHLAILRDASDTHPQTAG